MGSGIHNETAMERYKNTLRILAHVAVVVLKAMLIVTLPLACVIGGMSQSVKVFEGMIFLGVALWPFLTIMVFGIESGWW